MQMYRNDARNTYNIATDHAVFPAAYVSAFDGWNSEGAMNVKELCGHMACAGR